MTHIILIASVNPIRKLFESLSYMLFAVSILLPPFTLIMYLMPDQVSASGPTNDIRLVRQIGHDFGVTALTSSVSGKRIVSGDKRGNLKLWRADDAAARAEFNFGPNMKIRAAEFHPYKEELVALSLTDDGYEKPVISIFNLATGNEITRWQGNATKLAYSSDGLFLAGKNFSQVTVWNAETGKVFVGLSGADGNGIGFRDSKTLIYRDEGFIRLLNLTNGQTTLRLPSGRGKDFVLFNDGTHLIDLRSDSYTVCDLETNKKIVEQMEMLPNDRIVVAKDGLAAFATKASAYLMSQTKYPVTRLTGTKLEKVIGISGLTSIADSLLVSNGILYLGQRDGRIRRWAIDSDADEVSYLPDLGHWAAPVEALAVSKNDRLIALGDAHGVIDIFDTKSGIRRTFDPYNARPKPPEPNFGSNETTGVSQTFVVGGHTLGPAVTALRFERNGSILIASYRDASIRMIEPFSLKVLAEKTISDRIGNRLTLDREGRIITVGRAELFRWQIGEHEPLKELLGGPSRFLTDIAIDQTSGTFAVFGDGRLRFFSDAHKEFKKQYEGASYCVLSAGADIFLTLNQNGNLTAIEATSGKVVDSLDLSLGFVRTQASAINKDRVAIVGSGGDVLIAKLNANGRIAEHQMYELENEILSAEWIADGQFLALGSQNGTVMFMNPDTGKKRWRLTNLGFRGWIFDGVTGLFDAPQENWDDILFMRYGDNFAPLETGQALIAGLVPGLLDSVFARPNSTPIFDPKKLIVKIPTPHVSFVEPKATVEVEAGTNSMGTMSFSSAKRRFEIPSIQIGEPNGTVFARKRITEENRQAVPVRIKIEDGGSGIGECRLMRDRQVVRFFGAPDGDPTKVEYKTTISLQPGQNELAAYCFNNTNIPGLPERIALVTQQRLTPAGTAFIISLGIDKYLRKELRLTLAVADADLFAKNIAMRIQRTNQYNSVVPIVWKDEDVSRQKVIDLFRVLSGQASNNVLANTIGSELLRKATVDDSVIVFFAGHGELVEREYRLIMYDHGIGQPVQETVLTDSDLRGFFGKLEATDLMLVLDACQAGGAFTAQGEPRLGPFSSPTFAQMAYDKGVFFLAAAQDVQNAIEDRGLGHGLLTYVLVNMGLLKGLADKHPADETISVREFIEYPLYGVPALHAYLQKKRLMPGEALPEEFILLRGVKRVDRSVGVIQTPKAYLPSLGFNNDFIIDRRDKK